MLGCYINKKLIKSGIDVLSKETKDNGSGAAGGGLKDFHMEVANVSLGISKFFKKTFTKVVFDGPDIDAAEVQKSPLMFVSTHRSHVDYFAIGSNFFLKGFKNIRYAAGDNLTKLPWIGPKFLAFGAFAVSRDGGFERNYVRNLCKKVMEMMADGDAILVFPEGGRSYTGAMLEIRGGILNAALMMQAANPEKDVYLIPAAASYECPPDVPYFPLLLKGKKLRKKPNGPIRRLLGDIYYFGADLKAFAPFMFARFFGRKYGALYMDYGAPVSVKSLVDLEANRIQGARDEFAAHKASLDIVGEKVYKMFVSVFRILPIHVTSAAIKVAADKGRVTTKEIEKYAEMFKTFAVKGGCNCKTIGAMEPSAIVTEGLKSLRKLKAIKTSRDKVTVTKQHIIDYFAAAIPTVNDI